MTARLCRRCHVTGPHSPSASICCDCRNRARRDYEARCRAANARSEALARERRAAEAAHPYRRAEVQRLARAEQLKAAIKRRDALKRERARVVARIQAELEAERTSAKAKELARLQRRVTQAKRREAERQRLREALSTVRAWAQPWPPLTERMRHARDESRMWRAIVILEADASSHRLRIGSARSCEGMGTRTCAGS